MLAALVLCPLLAAVGRRSPCFSPALQASPPFSAPFQGPVQVDQQSLIMQAAAPAGAQVQGPLLAAPAAAPPPAPPAAKPAEPEEPVEEQVWAAGRAPACSGQPPACCSASAGACQADSWSAAIGGSMAERAGCLQLPPPHALAALAAAAEARLATVAGSPNPARSASHCVLQGEEEEEGRYEGYSAGGVLQAAAVAPSTCNPCRPVRTLSRAHPPPRISMPRSPPGVQQPGPAAAPRPAGGVGIAGERAQAAAHVSACDCRGGQRRQGERARGSWAGREDAGSSLRSMLQH